MLIVLSPAKTLDFSRNNSVEEYSVPFFLKEAEKLVKIIRKLKPNQLSELMGISAKLADLNYERYLRWDSEHNFDNSKQAVFAFKGEVYIGLDSINLNNKQLTYLNKNLRILSGLYGILKPFDLIHEYRLEMGIPLPNSRGNDLYSFWAKYLTRKLNEDMEQSNGEKVLINLASNEYFKSLIINGLKYPIITPIFKEYKDKEHKIISFYAKKARGMMTRFLAINNIDAIEDIKRFKMDRYAFNPELSSEKQWVFTR